MNNTNHIIQPLDPNETDIKIAELEKKISFLKIDGVTDASLLTLRNLVLDAHFDSEVYLQKIISKHLYVQAVPNHRYKGHKSYDYLFKGSVGYMFSNLRYKDKVDLAHTYKIVDKGLYDKLISFNKLRNEIAHPASQKITLYADPERKLFLLQLVFDVIQGLAFCDYNFHLD